MWSFDGPYHVHHGDAIEHMATLPDAVFDEAIFSPPFPGVYAYTDSDRDIGNSENLKGDAKIHLSFFYRQFARLIKPGRVVIVHVQQIPRMKRAGGRGLSDFRGMNIRLAERAGLTFEYDWLVRKNPQAQAIRGKAWELKFQGVETDRSMSRGTLCDYLLKFRAPGDNSVPIDSEGQVSRDNWIKWAEGAWFDIKETDTLNGQKGKERARGAKDVKHICLARGSLVLTRDGHKPIEDVGVGDLVLTHRGRWRPVTAVACNGTRPVVSVTAQGVADLRLTPDHRVWARSSAGRGGKGWEAGSMQPARHRHNATTAVPDWMPAADLKGHYVNLRLPPIEDSPYTAEEWWAVGRWLGDGHIDTRGRAHISCSFREEPLLVASLGRRAGFVHRTPTAAQVSIKDRGGRLRELLARCGKGCEGKRLPAEALALEPVKAESLLSGYLSADGHYVAKHCRWVASSVSRPLLLGMAMVAQRARGVVASVYAGRPPGTCVIEGRTVRTQQDWILSIPPQNLSALLLDDGAWKKVRTVEQATEAEVWDIQVEEDASFTAEGCVVHNCPLQLEVIDRLVRLYSNPGELVFSPFAGIGSELVTALKLGRRAYGCELKDEYHAACVENCEAAVKRAAESRAGLFDDIGDDQEQVPDSEPITTTDIGDHFLLNGREA